MTHYSVGTGTPDMGSTLLEIASPSEVVVGEPF